MDRQHLVSDSDAEIGLHILSKTTNFDYEIDQFLRELPCPCLLEYGVAVEHCLEHTQDLDVPCSSLSTISYGFIISGPGVVDKPYEVWSS